MPSTLTLTADRTTAYREMLGPDFVPPTDKEISLLITHPDAPSSQESMILRLTKLYKAEHALTDTVIADFERFINASFRITRVNFFVFISAFGALVAFVFFFGRF